MAAFVLIHGRSLGGWCWRRILPRLQAAGHSVYTPTLTGCGERSHLCTPTVNFATHTQDLRALLHCEDLRDVVVVGHGYGGLVASETMSHETDRVRQLVLLDAPLAETGSSYLDLLPSEHAVELRRRAATSSQPHLLPPGPISEFRIPVQQDSDWVEARLTPHPLATLEHKLEGPAPNPAATTYLRCTSSPRDDLEVSQRRAQEAGIAQIDLASGHYPMFTTPRRLADLLHSRFGGADTNVKGSPV